MIRRHVGASLDSEIKLDEWCITNGVKDGHDYLLLWCAFLFREPLKKLPYLFLHGPQNSGKSSFHEALSLLFERKRGYVEANQALTSEGGFNGELINAVLAVIEEVDLGKEGSKAYNRAKNWITAPEISIHAKFCDPYLMPNTCHFIQVANDRSYCFIVRGDTRITVSYVPPIEVEIEKDELFARIEKEAPDFLGHLFAMDLPQSGRRLALPVITTQDKIDAGTENQTPFEQFLETQIYRVPGKMIRISELFTRFKNWLDPMDAESITKQKMTSQLPPDIIKGRDRTSAQWVVANVSFTPGEPGKKLVRHAGNDYLIEETSE
jgi:hypothetical protein